MVGFVRVDMAWVVLRTRVRMRCQTGFVERSLRECSTRDRIVSRQRCENGQGERCPKDVLGVTPVIFRAGSCQTHLCGQQDAFGKHVISRVFLRRTQSSD